MRLSIIVDNYNYESFVSNAIESALSQTWEDTEVIVVDDGSTDDSRKRIDEYADRVITIYKENGGQGSALSLASEKATGDVVIFLDADDSIFADTGRRVMERFTEDPSIARVQWPLQVVDKSGNETGRQTPNPSMMPTGDLRAHVARFRTYVWSPQSGNAYSAKVLRRLLPIPEEFPMACDLYLAETSALLGDVHSLNEVGGTYRWHNTNYWVGSKTQLDELQRIHQGLSWTISSHKYVYRIGIQQGLNISSDPTDALDVAFACRRLASIRMNETSHPVVGDTRMRLVLKALHSAVRHPHHTRVHKAKRLGWILGVGLGNQAISRRLIKRFYFQG